MAHDFSKLQKAVESTGAKYAALDSFDFSKVKPVKLTPEQREIAEAEDRIYHAKLKKYYDEHPNE